MQFFEICLFFEDFKSQDTTLANIPKIIPLNVYVLFQIGPYDYTTYFQSKENKRNICLWIMVLCLQTRWGASFEMIRVEIIFCPYLNLPIISILISTHVTSKLFTFNFNLCSFEACHHSVTKLIQK